eukprot:comp22991_c4_seq1/m.36606 comp22991_c4_seq1/g.36606  ORF comp22991_c4_seq1/g.36606 comp22991_c4_seq1/m.36606 type:complete len:801 (-) comp22991_c4_seq1:43-2445(-)
MAESRSELDVAEGFVSSETPAETDDLGTTTPPYRTSRPGTPSIPSNHASSSDLENFGSSGKVLRSTSITGVGSRTTGDMPALQTNNPLSRKLNKILNLRLDQDKEVVEALKALSKFYTDNTLKARRNLRSDIERRSLEVNYEFLEAFEMVKKRLDEVQKEVTSMKQCCDEMNQRLQAAKEQTAGVIDTTNELQQKAGRVQVRAEVVDKFISRFQLTPEQMAALKGAGGGHALTHMATNVRSQTVGRQGETRRSSITPEGLVVDGDGAGPGELDETFFEALERAKQIHADCKVLLRSQHQIIGLEIMDNMTLLQETGYERVYRWAQSECRGLSRDTPEITPIFRRALQTLRDRPALLRYCIDEIGTARRATVIRQFIDALAIGGPGGFPRPIEMHSHDPLRYVSDMLAWLHQAVAAEQELLSTLLSPPKASNVVARYKSNSAAPITRRFTRTNADSENGGTLNGKEEGGQEQLREEVQVLLTRVMEGTCRPFKARLDQVLASDPGVVMCYKLANLLHFYAHTIHTHLGSNDALYQTIDEGRQTAFKVFMDSLRIHADRTMSEIQPPPPDLSPSPIILQTLAMLKELVASYSGSLIANPTEGSLADDPTTSIAAVLSAVLDPLQQLAQTQASTLSPANKAVYMLNCLTNIQTTLGLYEFASARLEALESQIESYLSDLVHHQASFILSKTGLSGKLQILARLTAEGNTTPLSECLGMEASAIRDTMQQFDTFLSSGTGNTSMAQCELLSSARLRRRVREQGLTLTVSAYATLYAAVLNPHNNYPEPTTIVPRTPEQVKTLIA